MHTIEFTLMVNGFKFQVVCYLLSGSSCKHYSKLGRSFSTVSPKMGSAG